MSTKQIPARSETTCDACGLTCSKDLGNPARNVCEGRLTLKRHALDMYGSPAADGTVKIDLCDACLGRIGNALNAECELIRVERRSS